MARVASSAIVVFSYCLISVLAIKEYVAMGPNTAHPSGSSSLQWLELEYPDDVSSSQDVKLTPLRASVPEIGAWYGLDPGGLSLTARIVEDTLYGLLDLSGSPNRGGCCADTLRMWPRDGGAYSDISLTSLVRTALNSTDAQASHTFDLTVLEDGTKVALLNVQYSEPAIGVDKADAVVGVDVASGALVRTADGESAFDIFAKAGTFSTDPRDSRFKLQYYVNNGSESEEQWHGNGVTRVVQVDGTVLLVLTHRLQKEAYIFKDPFTYKSSNGGGKIVQRFGTPLHIVQPNKTTWKYRQFGLKQTASPFTGGVHNTFYTKTSAALGGRESLSLFVNSQDGLAHAYEFEIKLFEEGSSSDPGDDTIFDVDYVSAMCTFAAPAQGGARTIGNGVFLVASGLDPTGFQIVDSSGSSQSHAYQNGTGGLFDPFIRVVAAQSMEALVV